ncbi:MULTISPECIES: hypothetical protein [Photorhabdus]|nr:hypothetical protein [Photorhabdus asymbiotica]
MTGVRESSNLKDEGYIIKTTNITTNHLLIRFIALILQKIKYLPHHQ